MTRTNEYTAQQSGDKFHVHQAGDAFLVISPSGNVHSVMATLKEAEAFVSKLGRASRQRRVESSY